MIALVALIGWFTNNDLLKGGYLAGITMKTNAAVCVALVGLSVTLLALDDRSRAKRAIVQVCSLAAVAIAGATFSQHVFGWDLGIDELLFHEQVGAAATQSPNRMGPVASLCLTLLGLGLLSRERRAGRVPVFQVLALSVTVVTSFSLLGYLFNAKQLFGIARFTGIALQTSVALQLLALALLLSKPGLGLAGRMIGSDAGALLIRRLLPAALLLPPALMLLRIHGERLGVYDLEFGRSLLVLAFIILFTLLVWRTGAVVTRQERSAAQAERVLRDRLVLFLESMTDGFVACDADWRVTYVNAAAERLSGVSRDRASGGDFWQMFPRVLSSEAQEQCRRAMRERVQVEIELHDQATDVYLELDVFPTGDGGLATYVRDVTEQRKALGVLRERELLFRTLGEAVPDFLWMADESGALLYLNPAWNRYTGLSSEELKLGWESLVHADDLPKLTELWRAARARGAPFQVESRVRRHDGVYRWFSFRVVPVLDETDRGSKWIGTGTDIDDHRRAQQTLAETDRRKNEFLATLAHELRNPLAPVTNAVYMLRRRGEASAESARAYEIVDRQIAHLTRLIDDLMDVGRISQDKLELRKSHVVLSEIVSAAVEGSRYEIDKKQQQLSISLPESPVELEGDAVRLVQVLTNLLSNAARYTPSGGSIRLTANRGAAELSISVVDSGIGIAPDQMPHIFEMFFQAERENRRGRHGLGIGLALVRKLVELHGGSVSAHSAGPGMGSEFVVRLPLPPAPVSRVEPAKPAHAHTGLVGLRVLVIEDNQDSADMLKTLLEDQGAEVVVAYDGESGLAASVGFAPQVVLLDIGLPGMSGYEVARELRRRDWGPGALLVALTGWGQADDRAQSQAAGFDWHLVKPVKPEQLLDLVQHRAPVRQGGGKRPQTTKTLN